MTNGFSQRRFRVYLAGYALLLGVCLWQFVASGDFSFGRRPWENLKKTAIEFSVPSFVNFWYGDERLEYKSDDGRVLRVENQRITEAKFLLGLAAAVWTTFKIAALGSLLAACAALLPGVLAARNMEAPAWVAWSARFVLGLARSIHTLVFGLILVGIIGLGPMAGVRGGIRMPVCGHADPPKRIGLRA